VPPEPPPPSTVPPVEPPSSPPQAVRAKAATTVAADAVNRRNLIRDPFVFEIPADTPACPRDWTPA